MIKFIHTADWQIGKPFNRIKDDDKRSRLREERFLAIDRVRDVIEAEDTSFVLVAGDLFDSPTPTKAVVSKTLQKIGDLKIPVFVIPGNHDFGGPGSLWEQDYFQKEQKELAPNFHLLLDSRPVETDECYILPCPLLKRHETRDVTAWLKNHEIYDGLDSEKPRIVVAHGSIQGFESTNSDEEEGEGIDNFIDIQSMNYDEIDYVALGDWHGTKKINDKVWYSGTHEVDRFPKGEDNDPGNILVVESTRGELPKVDKIKTSGMRWRVLKENFRDKQDVLEFQNSLFELSENKTDQDLLHLTVSGSLGMEGWEAYSKTLESIKARFIRVKLYGKISVQPSEEELISLTRDNGNELTRKVAEKLNDQIQNGDPRHSEVAEIALRELWMNINEKNH